MAILNKQLAVIREAHLEIQERGILNFWILVDYEDGGSQGVGGIALDEYCHNKKKRIGTAYGCEMIRRLLLTIGVDDFSEMAGRNIWVLGEGSGLAFRPLGIQTLFTDKKGRKEPLIFSDVAYGFAASGGGSEMIADSKELIK